jgi:hypothetical protein
MHPPTFVYSRELIEIVTSSIFDINERWGVMKDTGMAKSGKAFLAIKLTYDLSALLL